MCLRSIEIAAREEIGRQTPSFDQFLKGQSVGKGDANREGVLMRCARERKRLGHVKGKLMTQDLKGYPVFTFGTEAWRCCMR